MNTDAASFPQIRVLQQMTQLIMMNPERLREKTEEQKDLDQTNWVRPHGRQSYDTLLCRAILILIFL